MHWSRQEALGLAQRELALGCRPQDRASELIELRSLSLMVRPSDLQAAAPCALLTHLGGEP